jgi:hypothetical protein
MPAPRIIQQAIEILRGMNEAVEQIRLHKDYPAEWLRRYAPEDWGELDDR